MLYVGSDYQGRQINVRVSTVYCLLSWEQRSIELWAQKQSCVRRVSQSTAPVSQLVVWMNRAAIVLELPL